MFRLRRFYSQNRTMIWIAVIGLGIIILVLQVLNNLTKEKNENNSSGNLITTTVNNSYSIVTGEKLDNTEAIEINKLIDEFFKLCNEGKTKEAYDELLSNDCKEELFPNYEKFMNNYANQMFRTSKLYKAQAWVKNNVHTTYKVVISEDILASGKSDSNQIEDYFTIVEEDGKNKLNINSYIGKKEINQTEEKDNIKIIVINKKIYMDYENYTIKIENNTNQIILLDGFRDDKSMYLIDSSGNKRIAILNENIPSEFMVQRNLNITKEIKFNKPYSTDVTAKEISFDDIILNYESYNDLGDKNLYKDILKINIGI